MVASEEEIISHWKNDDISISVFCLSFNHEKFIEKTLEGFLIQKSAYRFEILIHDDASQDRTQDILSSYQKEYPNIIRLILQEDNQYKKKINPLYFLRKIAKGRYIAMCEGDDYWTDPRKLENQASFLDKNPEYIASGHRVISFCDEENVDFGNYHIHTERDKQSIEMLNSGLPQNSSRMYRNINNLNEIIGKDLFYQGDMILMNVLAHYGMFKFHHDIKPSFYRIHGGGVLSTKDLDKIKLMAMIDSQIKAYLFHRRNDKDDFAEIKLNRIIELTVTLASSRFLLKEALRRILFIKSLKRVLHRIFSRKLFKN